MKFIFCYTKSLLLLVFLLTATPSVFSQQFYPVHGTVQVLPPHGLYLSDYYSGTRDRLLVTLINRDHGQGTLHVRLRVTVRNGHHFMIRSRDELLAPVITLTPGIPVRLTGADLAPYLMPNRITMQGRLDNGRLPTGQTEFIVQVLDHATGQVLSQPATGSAWLEINQPPFLNLPAQGDGIEFRTPQHIRFQWMPRHTALAHTVYEFTLRELPDNDVPPQTAFLFGNTIYQTTTRFTTLNLTHLQPLLEPGRRYAWQVRAMTVDGIDEIGTFANHGMTEIGWFRVLENCPPPLNVRAEAGYRRMTVRWNPQHQHQSFVVEYRFKTYREPFEWNRVETFNSNELTIERLESGRRYEYRVGALCSAGGHPVFSSIGDITLPERDPQREARCGVAPVVCRENQEPIEHLLSGDVVMIGGDFPMTVIEATPLGGGWFAGTGTAFLTWIFDIPIAVRFDRLRVNTYLQQIDGVVITEYDPNASQIASLNELDYGGRRSTQGGVTFDVIPLEFALSPELPMSYNPETGELMVEDGSGSLHRISIPRNEEGESTFPIILEDANGDRFKVEMPEGSEADIAAGRTVTPIVTPIRDLVQGSFNTSALDENAGVVVRFSRGEGRFGFDEGRLDWYQRAQLIRDQFYQKWGTDYVAPWKLIPTNEEDIVEARIAAGSADPNNIFFVLADGTGVPARKDNDRWILTLPGTGHNQQYAVFAIYRQGNQNLPVGKLRVISYRQQSHTVTLVNVNARVEEAERARIEREVNEIFNRYGVTITVRTDDSIYENTDWDLDEDGRLNVSGSGFFTRETDEMRALRHVFQDEGDYVHGEYYIFILQEAYARGEPNEDLVVKGDMPRGQHFGFVFRNAVREDEMSRLIAHELGHGIFTLRHTFIANYGGIGTKGYTNNLMDYSRERGTELAAFQWNVMSYPAVLTRFDSEEEGRDLLRRVLRLPPAVCNENLMSEIIQKLRCALARGEESVYIGTRPAVSWLRVQAPNLNISVRPVIQRRSFILTENWRERYVRRSTHGQYFYDFSFADGLNIHIPPNHVEEFVRFMQNKCFEAEINEARVVILQNPINLERIVNTSYCVLIRLTNAQRIRLLQRIADLGSRGRDYHRLAIRIMENIPEDYTIDMFNLLSRRNIFGEFSRHMEPTVHAYFVRESFRAYLRRPDILRKLTDIPYNRVFLWHRDFIRSINYNLRIYNNSLIIGAEKRVIHYCLDQITREEIAQRTIITEEMPPVTVNMTELIGLIINTPLEGFPHGGHQAIPIPAFYFEWLIENHRRQQGISLTGAAITIASFAKGIGYLRTAIQLGRAISVFRVATTLITAGDLILLDKGIREALEESNSGFLQVWQLASLASSVVTRDLLSIAFKAYSNYLPDALGSQLYQQLSKFMEEINNN